MVIIVFKILTYMKVSAWRDNIKGPGVVGQDPRIKWDVVSEFTTEKHV